MNFKKIMSLTLITVLVISASAFGQSASDPKLSESIGANFPNTNFSGTPVYKPFVPTTPAYQSTFKKPDPTIGVGILKVLPDSSTQPAIWGAYGSYDLKSNKSQYNCPIWSLVCNNPNLGPIKGFNGSYSLNNASNKLLQVYESSVDNTCELAPKTNLDAIAEATDISSCYRNRGEDLPETNDYAQFHNDITICGCLAEKAKKLPALDEILKLDRSKIRLKAASDGSKSKDPRMDVLKRNFKDLRGQLDRTSDGLAFQASIIGDGNKDFAVAFSVNPLQENYEASKATNDMAPTVANADRLTNGVTSYVANVGKALSLSTAIDAMRSGTFTNLIKHMEINGSHSVDSSNESRTPASEVIPVSGTGGPKPRDPSASKDLQDAVDILAKPSKPTNPILLEGETNLEKPQCVGAREYMAFKSLPDNALVQNELRDPSKLTADNWNFKKLRAEYDSLMAKDLNDKKKNRNQIILLREKLKFLERNPMIKTYLGADASDLDTYFDEKPVDDLAQRNKIKSFYGPDKNGKDLDTRKKDLLAMMTKMAPPADCKTPECLFHFNNSADIDQNSKDLKSFFSSPSNALLTRAENDKTGIIKMWAVAMPKDTRAFQDLTKVFTVKNVEQAFGNNYGIGTPSQCNNPEESIDTCSRIYSGWCQELKEKSNLIEEQRIIDSSLVDTLDDDVKDYFEPDVKKNPEFQEFNEKVCNTKRTPAERSQRGNPKSFWDYKRENCAQGPDGCNTKAEMDSMRSAYFSRYHKAASPKDAGFDNSIASFNGYLKRGRFKAMSAADARNILARNNSFSLDSFNQMNRDFGFNNNIETPDLEAPVNTPKLADAAIPTAGNTSNKSENKTENTSMIDEPAVVAPTFSSYSNVALNQPGTTLPGADQVQKVENMSDPQRQDLMEDWQKEYDAWKKNKGNDNSTAAAATDASYQARIQALETLLAQQKKLTEDQYKLLNDAIAAKSSQTSNVAVNDNDNSSSSTSSNGRKRSGSSVSSDDNENDIVSRSPASIPDVKNNTSGATSGAGTAGVGSGSSTSASRKTIISSSDDVAREEAKLVRYTPSPDGSITIESTKGNSSSANAISVPVSDEQYRALQTSSGSFNLSQIEKSIPQDQIAKLEKNGEIVIFLRNGSNPPFEVKVEKKNNKLVFTQQNGKEQKPVLRTYTRDALTNQLKKANR